MQFRSVKDRRRVGAQQPADANIGKETQWVHMRVLGGIRRMCPNVQRLVSSRFCEEESGEAWCS